MPSVFTQLVNQKDNSSREVNRIKLSLLRVYRVTKFRPNKKVICEVWVRVPKKIRRYCRSDQVQVVLKFSFVGVREMGKVRRVLRRVNDQTDECFAPLCEYVA